MHLLLALSDVLTWGIVVGATTLLVLVVSYAVAAWQYGWLAGGDRIYAVASSAFKDLLHLSPRRTWAIAWLAMKESFRKQAVAGVVLFLVLLAFALWFLDTETVDPSALYITFVLTAVNYLVLLMAVITSAFSLPNDIKNRTIQTVVTKPVRASEIVLGRIVGFSIVCTIPLVVMGISSYWFVVRSLDHTHTLTEDDLRPASVDEIRASQLESGSMIGATSPTQNHSHRVTLDAAGNGTTEIGDPLDVTQGESDDIEPGAMLQRFGQSHRHQVTAHVRDGRRHYEVGPAEGLFHARVPIRVGEGGLAFKDLSGNRRTEGFHVGNWTKRDYVAGGTLSAAVYEFTGVDEATFPDGLRLQLDIRLFRTTKENMNRPILGSITLENPGTKLRSAAQTFAAREYFTLDVFIPRKLSDADGQAIDLFRQLVDDGRIVVELQCVPRSQFFGVGPDDVYLLAREGRFDVNFLKTFVGIWLQMVLAVAAGVLWSTFLSGPVALLATAVTIFFGLVKPTLIEIAQGKLYGENYNSGGMLESLVRMGQQKAAVEQLEEGATTSAITGIDRAVQVVLETMLRFIPDFTAMNDVETVARGFDVPATLLWEHAVTAAGFALPMFLIGFLVLKLSEVAK